jgi:cobalt-zinc-cadmium efflux system outer membrane protein
MMDTRKVRPAAAALLLLAAPAATSAQQAAGMPVPPLTLERLERVALDNNPTLRQAQAQIDAARGRARQAGAWPNPIVGYSGEEIGFADDRPSGRHGVFADQTVPLGGKLRLGRDVAVAEVSEAESLAAMQRHRVLNTVRTLFYQSLAAERRVEVQERLSQLVSEAVLTSKQLFNVGSADRPDVLEAEVEAFRARVELEKAQNRRFAVWRQLAAAVGDPDLPPQQLAGSIDSNIPELDRPAMLAALLDRSPELAAARAAVTRARAAVTRSRRETFPDLFLRGVLANNRERIENEPPRALGWQASLEAGVSVPLFNRNLGSVSAARAEEGRAEAEVRRIELALRSRFAGAFELYLTALRASETYRVEILPRAEEAYKLYLARYREMAAAYPQVLIAQRSLLELSDEYLASLDDTWRTALEMQGLLVTDGLGAPSRPGEPLDLGTADIRRSSGR